MIKHIILFVFVFVSCAAAAEEGLLQDVNGDGRIVVMGFGDSITYGQGDDYDVGEFVDGAAPGDGQGGYLERVRRWAGIQTANYGIRGEKFYTEGINRLPSVVSASDADIVGVFEGANDAFNELSSYPILVGMQKVVNVIRSLGKKPVLFTVLPPCCNRVDNLPFTFEYSKVIRYIAEINDVPLVDVDRAWSSTCGNSAQCYLYNVPEGLHPNRAGYDVIAQVLLAQIYDVNIFSKGGAGELEEKLGLTEGTVIVGADENE